LSDRVNLETFPTDNAPFCCPFLAEQQVFFIPSPACIRELSPQDVDVAKQCPVQTDGGDHYFWPCFLHAPDVGRGSFLVLGYGDAQDEKESPV
jgi:hypothetical protein